MFVISNTLATVAHILDTLLGIYSIVIIASAVISWVNPDPYNPIVRTLYALTEPVYAKVRRILPFTQVGGFDFTPIIVLLIIQLLEGIVVRSLLQFAYGV